MKLKTTKYPEKNTAELTFIIDKASFDNAVNEVYKKKVKNITINGFRKGKAPKHIIEKLYGTGFFYEDAINDLLPEAYDAALKESGEKAVGRPEIDIEAIDDKGVTVKAKFEIYPTDLTLKTYRGISAVKESKKITDEDVMRELEAMRNRNSRLIDITDRPAQNGDTTVIDYDGYCDGKRFDGGKAEKQQLVLGSGHLIPGFEDQVCGHNIGDSFDVNVTFPDPYSAKELAGKAATFKVKLHEIKYNELPALDDEFAKDVSEFDTLSEYKKDVKDKLQKRADAECDNAYAENLMDELIKGLEGDIPHSMIDTEVDNIINDYDMRLRQQGLDINTYFKYTGLKPEDMRRDFHAQAERTVKCKLALELVAKAEKVEVSDKDVEDELKKLADAYGMEIEKIRESVPADIVKSDLSLQKALEIVKANAKAKKPAAKAEMADGEKAEKAPAKKTAATAKAASKETKTPAKTATAAKKPAAAAKKETAAKTEKAPAKKTATTAKTAAAKKPAAKKTETAKKADK
ncbi:MAG: trigger factor [Clostridia bacterium]|nr:trigger factor [Clostridia bacterium]